MKQSKRFIAVKGYEGIRLDTISKKYVARKKIAGQLYTKSFKKLLDAIHWRKKFHPLLNDTQINKSEGSNTATNNEIERVSSRVNGSDKRFTFAQAWALYHRNHLASLEPQTIEKRLEFANNFLSGLMKYKMFEISPEFMDVFMKNKVEEALIVNNPRRKNFNYNLKFLKAFLNWYRENYDISFMNPVLKRHKIAGKIKPTYKNNQKMTLEQFHQFINSFDDLFWRDFAELHFFMAGRVQEVGGLQCESIDMINRQIHVVDVAIWGNDKKFSRLKEVPKNGEERVVFINDRMVEILRRRLAASSLNCEFFRESTGERLSFVFHKDGVPISYRAVQYRYNKALMRAGLYPKFSATHILRKAMANVVRKEMGLDAAQAAGGWKSRAIVEKIYTNAPTELNMSAVDYVGKLFSDIENDSKKKKLSIVGE